LFLSLDNYAEELHVFSNGTVADAEKINENFQLLDQKIKAFEGCTATQDGSSVKIECADGSVGVIAGAGTVLIYPEGKVGEVPVQEYNTGQIVLVDGNQVVLGRVDIATDDMTKIFLDNGAKLGMINTAAEGVLYSATSTEKMYFLEKDCAGAPFGSAVKSDLWDMGGIFYTVSDQYGTSLVTNSYKRSAAIGPDGKYRDPLLNCVNAQGAIPHLTQLVEYSLAPEIIDAAYPISLKQLP